MCTHNALVEFLAPNSQPSVKKSGSKLTRRGIYYGWQIKATFLYILTRKRNVLSSLIGIRIAAEPPQARMGRKEKLVLIIWKVAHFRWAHCMIIHNRVGLNGCKNHIRLNLKYKKVLCIINWGIWC